jgi:hypothetical protein
MSVMKVRFMSNQSGSMNVLLIPLILSAILLLGAIGFSVWAFAGQQDYKNNSDQKSAAAVAVATERTKSEKDNEFLQREKEPLKNYTSPVQFGSFSLKYPKTWSAYSDEKSDRQTLLMQPDVISSNINTPYALKVEVVSQQYTQMITQLDNDIKVGKLTASAFTLAKVPDVVGLRVDGKLTNDKTGAAVYLPLRDKTIKISTESPDKVADFNNIILPNFEFKP